MQASAMAVNVTITDPPASLQAQARSSDGASRFSAAGITADAGRAGSRSAATGVWVIKIVAPPGAEHAHFSAMCILKTIFLPRQARDKRKETVAADKEVFFAGAWVRPTLFCNGTANSRFRVFKVPSGSSADPMGGVCKGFKVLTQNILQISEVSRVM
jgi:hypothetical protein